jgi:hypothetical protein
MVPQTADIEGLPAGAIEQNFDYDLLSPGALLAKSIGQSVQLVRTDPKTGKTSEQTATVRSGPDGAVLEINGRFEALQCGGLPAKLVFDHLPEGLADTPTLSLRTDAAQAGRYTIALSYIATGLNWSADYVARIAPGTDSLALSGWLTLANFSTTGFTDAPVSVVAGHVATTGGDRPIDVEPIALTTHCWPMKIDWGTHRPPPVPPPPPRAMMAMAAPMAAMESVSVTARKAIEAQQLGDYKLYPLPEPTTVSAQQTKQIQFLDQSDVAFSKLYRYDVDTARREAATSDPAQVVLRLHNTTDAGLGKPLPAGSVTVFEPAPDSSLVFTGENAIADMSVGLPVEIETGRAADVRALARLAQSEASGSGGNKRRDDSWEVTLVNDKSVRVSFELRQRISGVGTEILASSDQHSERAGYAVWDVPLAPGARAVVTYTIRTAQ